MLCDDCGKNEAVFHSVRKINGVEYERHLCAECHAKSSSASGLSFLGGSGLSELSGLLAGFPEIFGSVRRAEHACSACGTKFSDFLSSGFLGCGHCYTEFCDALMPVIQKVQGSLLHKGKIPAGAAAHGETAADTEDEYKRLACDLANAVEAENYEEASVIRDRMRAIKESGNI